MASANSTLAADASARRLLVAARNNLTKVIDSANADDKKSDADTPKNYVCDITCILVLVI
jgi:hypothetical protein